MIDFKYKIVAVTGAARGIGKTITERFAQQGAHVFVCDRDQAAGEALVESLRTAGHAADFVQVNLASPGEPERMIREVCSKAGRLNILVNNARSGSRVPFLQETDASWEAGISVTLKAAFFASQEATKHMKDTGGGAILNISSVAAHLATHESSSYHIAKAAMVQMTRHMAASAGGYGVRVNCICPGFIVQDEHRKRFDSDDNAIYRAQAEHCHPLGTVGTASDVAEACLFLCSTSARFITGEVMMLDGGATLNEQFCLLRDFVTRKTSGATNA